MRARTIMTMEPVGIRSDATIEVEIEIEIGIMMEGHFSVLAPDQTFRSAIVPCVLAAGD